MFVPSLMPYGSGPRWTSTLEALGRWAQGRRSAGPDRISPRLLAASLGLDGDLTVDAFLAGALEGWFDLRWDFRCPSCGGVAHSASHLTEARSEDFCPGCRAGFRNELDGNVEVVFTAAPRLVSLGQADSGDGPGDGGPAGGLSGLEVLHRPLFQRRFGDEVLGTDQSLEVRQVVLLFTDIRGSTRLYETLGDAKAYALVRQHFDLLFEAIRAHGGLVVKTIGDAVMASFRSGAGALEAALHVHDTIAGLKVPGTDEAVVVKMGLHGGPALAVTLNGRFDYFGQSVNRAARIQGLVEGQEIAFSDAVFRDPDCRRLLTARKAAVRRRMVELRGIDGEQLVYSVK